MIEQLWYTWSTHGLGPVTGFRVRAASTGLADIRSQRFHTLNPFFYYKLPTGTIPEQAQQDTSPVCLIFADAGDKRLLVQKVFAGADAYGRIGIYFCHLVTELPTTFLASHAIELWKSSFWQVSDERLEPNKTQLPEILPAQLLQGPDLKNELPQVSTFVAFAIQAFLSLEANQKLYIMAPDTHVAALIWAITRSVPLLLQQQLTFSTYEHDVLKGSTRIIGTCRPTTPPLEEYAERIEDIPASCYYQHGLALNCYKNKYSELKNMPRLVSFAAFAAQSLLTGETQQLNALLIASDQLGMDTTEDFLMIYRFFATEEEPLTTTDISMLFSRPKAAFELLNQEGVQQAVIRFVLTESLWWQQEGETALSELEEHLYQTRRKTPFASFAELVIQAIFSRFQANDKKACITLLRLLDIIAPPRHNREAWLGLLRSFPIVTTPRIHPLHAYKWETRKWLLQQWTPIEHSIEETRITQWLIVSWNELQELLTFSIPKRWHVEAIKSLLTDPQVTSYPSYTLSLVMKYHELFQQALKELMQTPQTQEDALLFFTALAQHGYPEKLSMLTTLLFLNACDSSCIYRLLEATYLTLEEQTFLFDQHGIQLLQRLAGGESVPPIVFSMITRYMHNVQQAQISKGSTKRLLIQMAQLPLPEPLASNVQNWLQASKGVKTDGNTELLKIEPASLSMMGEAIAQLHLQQNQQYMDKLNAVLVSSIFDEQDLACVVETLGKPLTASRRKLLMALLLCIGKDRDVPANRLLPYIMYAFSTSTQMVPHDQEKFLHQVFSTLFKNIDPGSFNWLENTIIKRDAQHRLLWNTFAQQFHPKTFKDHTMGFVKGAVKQFTSPSTKAIRVQPSESERKIPAEASEKKHSNDKAPVSQLPRNTTEQIPHGRIERMVQVRDLYSSYQIYSLSPQISIKNSPNKNNEISAQKTWWEQFLATEAHQKEAAARRALTNNKLIHAWITSYKNEKWAAQLQKTITKNVAVALKGIKDLRIPKLKDGYQNLPNEVEYKKLLHIFSDEPEEYTKLLSIFLQDLYMQKYLNDIGAKVDWKVLLEQLQSDS